MFHQKALLSLLLLANFSLVVKGLGYNPLPVRQEIVTSTRYQTDTRVHTVRLTSTNDVIITQNSVVYQTVTQFTTNRDFVEEEGRTVVSVIHVTNTPVIVRTVEVAQNPVRSVYAVQTRFVTNTQTVNIWSTLTHVRVQHQVRTVPVVATETQRQRVLQTETQYITITITSTTRGY